MFEVVKTDFQRPLPELQETHAKRHQRPIVKFLEGRKGAALALEDLLLTLKRGGVYYRYSSRRAGATVEPIVGLQCYAANL